MKTLGFRLVEARKNFGLTQKQVAERLFITTQAISSWESGNSVPDTEKIPEIASLYGVTTDWLLSGKERAHPHLCHVAGGGVPDSAFP